MKEFKCDVCGRDEVVVSVSVISFPCRIRGCKGTMAEFIPAMMYFSEISDPNIAIEPALAKKIRQMHQRRLNQQARDRVDAMPTRCMNDFFKKISVLLPRRREPMFKDAEPGDRVWSVVDGWGSVYTKLPLQNKTYPLAVQFESGDMGQFTIDGRHDIDAINPTIYWASFDIVPPPKPKKKVKKYQILYRVTGQAEFRMSIKFYKGISEFRKWNPSSGGCAQVYEPSMIEVEE